MSLTHTGLPIAKKIWDESPPEERRRVSELKSFLNKMNYWEIIAFSYSTFPETTTNSNIKLEFERNRRNAAVGLFKNHDVSLKKAASIAGTSVEDFEGELKKRGIRPYSMDTEKYNRALKLVENIT